MTHTYAVLDVTRATYEEIRAKLDAAGYADRFHEDGLIDLHGLAIQPQEEEGTACGTKSTNIG